MSVIALTKSLVLKNFLANKAGLDLKSLEDALKNAPIDEFDGITTLKLKRLSENDKVDLINKVNNAIDVTGLTVRPYQYIALLMTALHLNWLKNTDQDIYLSDMNAYSSANYPNDGFVFDSNDLAYMAFWMATAAGKTMILHAVMGLLAGYGFEFDGVILLSPSSALSVQHAKALEPIKKALGKNLILYSGENPTGRVDRLNKHDILITEYSKITADRKKSKEAKTLLSREFAGRFLVIVDEGHKGTKTLSPDESGWKVVQQQLAGLKAMDGGTGRINPIGMIVELSATLGQVAKGDYLAQYAKTVVYDYAYNKFNKDGYGKTPVIRNQHKTEFDSALLLSMLTYFWQLKKYEERQSNNHIPSLVIEKPLWVLLGLTTTASGKKSVDEVKLESDVQKAIAFIKQSFNTEWLTQAITKHFKDDDNELSQNLSQDSYRYLLRHKDNFSFVAQTIIETVYGHQQGQFVLREIKSSSGSTELGLGLHNGHKTHYFGVINIGDVSGYAKYAKDNQIDYSTEISTGSLFEQLSNKSSSVNLLIGSRKFAEGWDNYRASTLTLLRLGVSEGALIVQMFGRMVRLRGVNHTGKRLSKAETAGYETLQSAYIFGAGSDYLEKFVAALSSNGIDLGNETTKSVPVTLCNKPLSDFTVPVLSVKPKVDFTVNLSDNWWWMLAKPKKSFISGVTIIESTDKDEIEASKNKLTGHDLTTEFAHIAHKFFDEQSIYQKLCADRHALGFWNLHITIDAIKSFFQSKHYEITGFDYHLKINSIQDIKRLEDIGYMLLKSAVLSLYRRVERMNSHYETSTITDSMIPMLETQKIDEAA